MGEDPSAKMSSDANGTSDEGTKKVQGTSSPSRRWKGGNKSRDNNNKDKMNGISHQKSNASKFKGKNTEMNGHTFQCHNESGRPGQYVRTCEELVSYCSKKYDYGSDVAFIVKHLKEYNMNQHKPVDMSDTPTKSKEAIWGKKIDIWLKREEKYKEHKKALYMVIWDQCSESMRTRLKALDEWDIIDERQDPLKLLKGIQGISYKFESQRYIHASIF